MSNSTDQPPYSAEAYAGEGVLPQSSVEIRETAKGDTQITVKVYAPTIWAAADLATKSYVYTQKALQDQMEHLHQGDLEDTTD